MLLVFVAIRILSAVSAEPRQFVDSADYLYLSRIDAFDVIRGGVGEPLKSPVLERNNGLALPLAEKPPMTPVLLKLTSQDLELTVLLQALLGASAWAWLAVEARRRSSVAAAGVILVGLSDQVVLWDATILSDSLSITSLAAMLAGTLALIRAWSWPHVLALSSAAVIWAWTRDMNAYLLVPGAIVAAVTHMRVDRRWLILPVVASLAFLVAFHGSRQGDRGLVSLFHVFSFRVAPDPEAISWLADRGMPQSDALVERAGATVDDDYAYSSDLAELNDWIRSEGQSEYMAYLISHPGRALLDPVRGESLDELVAIDPAYRPAGQPRPLPASWLLVPGHRLVLLIHAAAAIALTTWVAWRRRWGALALLSVLFGWAAVSLPLNWHADGYEYARHAKEALVLLPLGLLAGHAELSRPTRRAEVP